MQEQATTVSCHAVTPQAAGTPCDYMSHAMSFSEVWDEVYSSSSDQPNMHARAITTSVLPMCLGNMVTVSERCVACGDAIATKII